MVYGLCFYVAAADVNTPDGGTLSEFYKKPKITAEYIDPQKNNDKKATIKVLTKVPSADGSEITEVDCEWKRYVLYDKKELALANKEGTYTSTYLGSNAIVPLICTLKAQAVLEDKTKFEAELDMKVVLAAPEITAVDQTTVSPESVIVITGKYFGCKPPKVWLEYRVETSKGTTIKKQKLKVDKKALAYPDSKGNEGKSCMDITNGDSEITVIIPKKWWKDWTAGTYNLVIEKILKHCNLWREPEPRGPHPSLTWSLPVVSLPNPSIYQSMSFSPTSNLILQAEGRCRIA